MYSKYVSKCILVCGFGFFWFFFGALHSRNRVQFVSVLVFVFFSCCFCQLVFIQKYVLSSCVSGLRDRGGARGSLPLAGLQGAGWSVVLKCVGLTKVGGGCGVLSNSPIGLMVVGGLSQFRTIFRKHVCVCVYTCNIVYVGVRYICIYPYIYIYIL